jgi:hypothetical protein
MVAENTLRIIGPHYWVEETHKRKNPYIEHSTIRYDVLCGEDQLCVNFEGGAGDVEFYIIPACAILKMAVEDRGKSLDDLLPWPPDRITKPMDCRAVVFHTIVEK